MKIANEDLFKKKLLENGINLFLGAGFSTEATNRFCDSLPLGAKLKELLIKEFSLNSFETLTLPQISQVLVKRNKNEFYEFLKNTYTVNEFKEIYFSLDNIKIKNIFTLNIDNLIENIFETNKTNQIIYDVEKYGKVDFEGISYFKLHGSVTYPFDKDLLFTPEDLSTLFSRNSALFHSVSLKISSFATLFWGTQLEDANVLALNSEKTRNGFEESLKWIVITPNQDNDKYEEYYSLMGFNVIRAYTIDLLKYFSSITNENKNLLIELPEDNLFRINFSNNYINSILEKNHPKRPLKTFFTGDDPVWGDIIDNKIIKLSYYQTILSKILTNNGEYLITGGLGSGKSTILMQLAVDKNIDGTKFYFNSITEETAKNLLKIVNNLTTQIYIFIDNLQDNLDAYLFIKNNIKHNYSLICSERDFAYEMIINKCTFKNYNIIDITELEDIDIQAICNLVHNYQFKRIKNEKMSLFELSYFIWEGKKLKEKINDIVKLLSNNVENEVLLEFFTLMAYVRSCGISASMDMLLLYYTYDYSISFETIYKMSDRLSSLIDDEDHYSKYSLQDFFTLRSVLFAEIALKLLKQNVLQKVLTKFANNVHKDSIVRYDIFKKKAYDADIISKAFPTIEEGCDFYNRIIEMESTEFKYQQYAIYLFRNGKLKEAWDKIEVAHNINRQSFSIKNTHAYILFKNNITVKEDINTVIETLTYTFEIIESCINKNKWATFHITTYADNSLQFYDRFYDSEFRELAHTYFSKSYDYIIKEMNKDEFISKKNKEKLYDMKRKYDSYIKKYKVVL